MLGAPCTRMHTTWPRIYFGGHYLLATGRWQPCLNVELMVFDGVHTPDNDQEDLEHRSTSVCTHRFPMNMHELVCVCEGSSAPGRDY
jgi:hypothetical protein